MNIFGDFYDGLPGDGHGRQLVVHDGDEYEYPVNDKPSGRLLEEHVIRRFPLLLLLALLVFLRLGYSLTKIQLLNNTVAAADIEPRSRTRPIPILPPRGIFLDNTGQPLLKNTPSFALAIIPAEFPTRLEERHQRLMDIAVSTGTPEDKIADIEKKWVFTLDPILLKDNLSRDDALILQEKISQKPGAAILISARREYEHIPGLSHILGYIGRLNADDQQIYPDYGSSDTLGKAGLERQYESEVRGTPGKTEVEVNARGQVERILQTTKAIPGSSVKLYLDVALQQKAAESLRVAIDHASAKAGAVIIMDPRNGGILASVSLPDYDNNLFAQGISQADYDSLQNDDTHPLVNRVTYGQYPSGSTIKPFIAAAALAENVIDPARRITTPSEIKIGQWTFRDWKPHGSADMRQAIAESNNIYFYSIGGGWDKVGGLGIDRIAKYLQKFGFGKQSNVDLPTDAKGLIPTPDWKQQVKKENWYIGDTYNTSIGQGDVLITPLQLAKGISAIANGGTLYAPRYAKALILPNNQEQAIPPVIEDQQVVSRDNIQVIQEGMRQTVEAGTTRPLQEVGVPVSAKTGTAQFTSLDKDKTHAWTVAYAPSDHPELVVVVVVEGGGESFDVAVPVIKDILQWKWPKT